MNKFTKCDEMRVNHENIITEVSKCFERIAGEHADILMAGSKDLNSKGLKWFVVQQRIEINLSEYEGSVVISTWPLPRKGVVWRRNCLIETADNIKLASCCVDWAIYNSISKSISRNEDVIYDFENYCMDNANSKQNERLKGIIDKKSTTMFEIVVDKCMIDSNGHVNNRAYLSWCIPYVNTTIDSIEIKYVNQAYDGDVVNIYIEKANTGEYVISKFEGIRKEDDVQIFIAEFQSGSLKD